MKGPTLLDYTRYRYGDIIYEYGFGMDFISYILPVLGVNTLNIRRWLYDNGYRLYKQYRTPYKEGLKVQEQRYISDGVNIIARTGRRAWS